MYLQHGKENKMLLKDITFISKDAITYLKNYQIESVEDFLSIWDNSDF